MWSQVELQQIEDEILERLPRVLEHDPRFVTFIEGIVVEKFPRRDEFARLLDEMTKLRQEQREGFAQADQRLEDEMTKLRQEQREGFDRVDRRFEQVDQRFERVDRRFEQVDQRFERVDRRFEQVDQRFERVDQQFEQMGQRFDDLKSWVQVVVGGMQRRYGRNVEDLIARTLRLALKWEEVDPAKIRVRQKLPDPEGLIGSPGRVYEVDLYAEDKILYALEIKSTCDVEDVDNFHDKVDLVKREYPDKEVQAVLISLETDSGVQTRCEELGIRLVA